MEAEEPGDRMQDPGASVSFFHALTPLSRLRRPRIYSFVFGLAVVFLIMASYMLSSDGVDFFLTSPPYHRTLLFNLSSAGDSAHIAQVLRRIHTNLEFLPRKLPDRDVLIHSEAHMFSVIPRHFLPDVKNPCWYEQLPPNASVSSYEGNVYSRRIQRQNFQKRLIRRDGKRYQIRCLPFFYIIGQPKCGTTDLYTRLRMHPHIRASPFKEPHWWTRRRFGIFQPYEGLRDPVPVEHYLDLFDHSAQQIQTQLLANGTAGDHRADFITGEASASTMWDNSAWFYINGNANTTELEPPILIQDLIHALQPDTRLITILRDPVERLYSDYLYFIMANKSVEDFQEKVVRSIQLFDACLQKFSLRACLYSKLNNIMPVRLNVGMYALFLMDWLSVFSREQLLVLRLEDHAADKRASMNRVFHFLQLDPLSEQEQVAIAEYPAANTRRLSDRSRGPMLPHTRCILTAFYTPFNRKLANMLNDTAFLWEEHTTHTTPHTHRPCTITAS